MFNKSIITVAVLGAATFSANSASLEEVRVIATTAQNNAAHALIQNTTQDKKIAANKNQIDEVRVIATTAQNNAAHALIQNSTQDKNITANKDAIAANKDAISANKDAISANKDAIDLGNRVNNVQNQQIGQLQSQNVTQDKNIAANKDAIAANKDAIAANTETIAKNYTEMKNNFTAVNQRIDDLDEEMKKGFASQAALAGLFQPYNVGKFNLSVALGGYESEQAMALGTGYRFNENFAMKAGIATDVGGFDHLTYNIGANFEW